MKKAKKYALIVAAVCVAAGAALMLAVGAVHGFDLSELDREETEMWTIPIEAPFTALEVHGASGNVTVLRADDGACRVECEQTDRVRFSAAVTDGTLRIALEDNRRWYDHIGFFWHALSVTVYLPGDAYDSLQLTSTSGDIRVEEGFAFGAAALETASGAVAFSGTVEGALTVQTTSGDAVVADTTCETLFASSTAGEVTLRGVTLTGVLTLSTVSGDQTLETVTAGELTASATSGNLRTQDLRINGQLDAETVSGDVRLTQSDAASLRIGTTSGDVNGSLLSPKAFATHTTSGDVDVPQSVQGAGLCEVTTTSGDITFRTAGD